MKSLFYMVRGKTQQCIRNPFFPLSKQFYFKLDYGTKIMETSDNKKQLEMLLESGVKVCIVPVQNLFNEDQRVAEVKLLGILDLDLRSENRYNSMTQIATYLTDCPKSTINILGSSVQKCKTLGKPCW